MNQWKDCLLKFLMKNHEILYIRLPTALPKEITNHLRIFTDFLTKKELLQSNFRLKRFQFERLRL